MAIKKKVSQGYTYKHRKINTDFLQASSAASLVHTLERRHRLALLLVQRVGLHRTVLQVHLAVGLLLPRQGVLHPVLVITLGVVLPGVGATGLLAVGGGNGGLGTRNR